MYSMLFLLLDTYNKRYPLAREVFFSTIFFLGINTDIILTLK